MQEMHEINGRDIGMDSVAKSNSLIGNNEVDDFAKNPNELMKLSGLGHNFKRNAKRKLEKADQNSLNGDDSESKQLVPDKYGYGLFDVVEPPYNLISLSKIYEVSAANFAAINAKVANIVGLGYSLDPTLQVLQMLEETTDSDQLARKRRKLDRTKLEIEEWLESRNDEEFLYLQMD